MIIDRKSLVSRLIIPVFITVIVILTVLVFSIYRITTNIIKDFVGNALSVHVSETMRIIEMAQADLTTARLLDNPPVVEAKKRLVIEAITLKWQRSDVLGEIKASGGTAIFSSFPDDLDTEQVLSKADRSGVFDMEYERGELHGKIIDYPAWGWRIIVATRSLSHGEIRREVFYLIPLMVVGSGLIVITLLWLLRKNLQNPVSVMVEDVRHGKTVRSVGISEFDLLGATINNAFSDIARQNEELAYELNERRKAEALIEEEKNKFESIIAALGDGVSIQDREFNVIYQNDVHKGFTGDYAGKKCYKVFENKDDICEGCPVLKTFHDGKVHHAQRTVERPGGTRYFDITTSPLRDASGNMIACIELVRDVTDRRRADEHLYHSQRMESVGQLAGGVAHDFNNILSAIIGYSEMLQMEITEEGDAKSYVSQILAAADRASGLTRSLLAFSSKQPATLKPISINDTVHTFYKMLRRLVGEDIEFKLDIADERLMVEADKGQFEQVLMNLVTNARDAMPSGGRLQIKTELLALDEQWGEISEGRYALISVSDTGAGMSSEMQNRIFEPFFTTKEVGRGTGLGLAITYGIVKKHNGYIHVYSEPGKGTTFRIYMPLIESWEKDLSDMKPVMPPSGTETVLLVEDEGSVRAVTASLLQRFGYHVIEAVDGEDAVRVFREKHDVIDLVLCDLIMPKKDGKEACDEIRKIRPGMKCIFMSGYTADIISQKAIAEEGIPFISKPLFPTPLLTTIREVLDKA